jgi:hypothetical protein
MTNKVKKPETPPGIEEKVILVMPDGLEQDAWVSAIHADDKPVVTIDVSLTPPGGKQPDPRTLYPDHARLCQRVPHEADINPNLPKRSYWHSVPTAAKPVAAPAKTETTEEPHHGKIDLKTRK